MLVFALIFFLIGTISGLRSMIAPAAVSWAAYLGWADVAESYLTFMSHSYTPWIFTVLAVGELVTDKLPITPSRKIPVQLIGRLLSGALCGATISVEYNSLYLGATLGLLGALAGTYLGAAVRARLATYLGKDWPAAIIEDLIAISGAVLIVCTLQTI